MPDVEHHSSNSPQLPVDAAVDALLADVMRIDDPAERHKSFAQRAAAADLHMAVGIGRRLLRTRERLRELHGEGVKFQNEIDRLCAPLLRAEADLLDMLGEMAKVRRDAGLGNFMDVPGLGRVATTAPAPRWGIDNAVAIAGLAGEARTEFVEPVPPAPPSERLKGPDLRKHLDALLADAVAKFDTAAPSWTEAMRERLTLEAAERIAAAYPGVSYVPGEIRVDYRLNDVEVKQ